MLSKSGICPFLGWPGICCEALGSVLERHITLLPAENVPAKQQFDCGAVMGESPAIAMAPDRFVWLASPRQSGQLRWCLMPEGLSPLEQLNVWLRMR